jgi:tRNA(fMet)-specific endonuclease VapC
MYLLDTNICIYIINKSLPKVDRKIESINSGEIKISTVAIAELEYGASKSQRRDSNRKVTNQFLSSFEIIPFEAEDAEVFGIIRANLERRGEIIGAYDMMLAAQALSRGLVFVTNNTAEFERVTGLRLENWAA